MLTGQRGQPDKSQRPRDLLRTDNDRKDEVLCQFCIAKNRGKIAIHLAQAQAAPG